MYSMRKQMVAQMVEQVTSPSARILIVEDDPDIQQLLREILTGANFTVDATDSGQEALRILDQQEIDLLLLDVLLPDLSGYEVCERVRERHLTELPILMLTALAQPEQVTQGLEIGADDYLIKPFIPRQLVLRVENLLRRQQAVERLVNQNDALQNTLQLVQQQLTHSQTEAQNEAILRRELLHNVTTHMQALIGIVEAELRKLPPSPERDAVQRVRMRIRGAALVYEVSEALQADPTPIDDLIRTIASGLKSMYRPWKRITVTVEGGHIDVPNMVASPLTMIVNELITNCFRHAFPDNRYGTIHVAYSLAGSTFQLDVVDNGIGLGQAITPERTTTGNGRRTISHFVQTLGGTAVWDSDGSGTRVRVALPIAQ
jgi:DNA-binding response OmpR family regulator